MDTIWLWIGFTVIIVGILALDLGVLHRKAHATSTKEAAVWVSVWVSLALLFCVGIFVWRGTDDGFAFLTGYVVEYSLSVDNVFVFVLLFAAFQIPPAYQHRVLFWGIVGAVVMRAAFILVGATLLNTFHWMIFVFGGFLVYTGIKLAFAKGEMNPQENPVFKLIFRFLPVTREQEEQKFFIVRNGRRLATPLFITLVAIETTDVIFALDSIPAIFGITTDPFLVYTSNIFAILGLRALYFLLAGAIANFHYLKPALAVILSFVGAKMLLSEWVHLESYVSLSVIMGVLVVAMIASIQWSKRHPGAGVRHEVAGGVHGAEPRHP
ncbi:MAG: TerC family protein [SAR202 cluster bacterium]|nr:TerC family protein [SAR202 cluster bacterium]